MKEKRKTVTKLFVLLSLLFLAVSGIGLFLAGRYISDKLLRSGESMAIDVALLVRNNFEITDDEVAYMKSLTFNEMEVDPINKRLMDIGDGVSLNSSVSNVYLLAPLSAEDYRYCPDEESAAFLGYEMDTPLDGVWLLNGRINEDGDFEVAQREDIYRYTKLDEDQLRGMEQQEPFGTFTADAWGSFITGYVPIYTVEGTFVGLLGIDMDPDPYQSGAQQMILLIIVFFAVVIVLFSALSALSFLKYAEVKDIERRFSFFSDMSHEIRTPLNGILGMAEVSKNEGNVAVLQHNFEQVERSGTYLLKLINRMLDYKGDHTAASSSESDETGNAHSDPTREGLCEKKVLLCEDNLINAEITRRMLEEAGCRMELAENGRRGLEMFSEAPSGFYDAILMDIRMPVMDGIEATQRIRALNREDARSIPIIALTANSYEEDVQKTKAAGMNAHLTKPVDPSVLYKTLSASIIAAQREA